MRNSAELRWFFRTPPSGLKQWFIDQGGFSCPAGGGQQRKDRYLIDREQAELGIKIRAEQHEEDESATEIKGLVVTAGPIDEGAFQGTIQIWTKWLSSGLSLKTFPTIIVAKTRWLRKFQIEGAHLNPIPLDENEKPLHGSFPDEGCNLEYTEIALDSPAGPENWCTLGFESFGPLDRIVPHLRITTHHIAHRHPPPSDFSSALEMSYPSWLSHLASLTPSP